MTAIFNGTVKEKTEKHLIVETSRGIHRVPLNHIVEVNGTPEVKFDTLDIIGKTMCVLSIDGKFWLRIMGDCKH